DPYGNQLFNSGFAGTGAGSDVATLTLGPAGTYTLLVEGAIGDTGTGSYTLNVQPMGNVPPTVVSGTPLVLGATAAGNATASGQQDRYTFTLASQSLLYFDALTFNGSLNWTLAGPAGTAVNGRGFTGSDGPNLPGDPALSLPAGAYTLTVA